MLVITSLVTAFTLYEVSAQATAANELAVETAPQVQIANDVERYALSTMKEMKTYELTDDAQFYDKAMKNLEKVEASLAQAQEHVKKHPDLTTFGAAADKVSGLVKEYRGLTDAPGPNTTEMLARPGRHEQGRGPIHGERRGVSPAAPRLRRDPRGDACWAARRPPRRVESAGDRRREGAGRSAGRARGLTQPALEKMRVGVKQEDRLKTSLDGSLVAAKDYGAQIKVVQAAMLEDDELGRLRGAAGTPGHRRGEGRRDSPASATP